MKQINETTAAFILGVIKYLGEIAIAILPILKNKKRRKMCLYPKLIKNPKYKANKKNGGQVPPIFDDRVVMVPIGCGKCMECCKQKANNWRVRLHEEIKKDNSGTFVTLTFNTGVS